MLQIHYFPGMYHCTRQRRQYSTPHSVVWVTLQTWPWHKDFSQLTTCSTTIVFITQYWLMLCLLFASTQSWHDNKSAQMLSSDFRWSHAYPIQTNGYAHDALSLMFQKRVSHWSFHGLLKGKDIWQVLPETSRCCLLAKYHWILLPLAEYRQPQDEET